MIYTVSNGSGGSPNVLIKTETGATVTLSKGDIVLTKVAENGEALFESVEYGTWTAVATLGDKSTSIQVVVNETIEEEINMGLMLSSLPLKTTKLKIGGIKWVLFARNHDGYPSGAQTLISEYTVGTNTSFGSTSNYDGSTLQSRMEGIYSSFAGYEKNYILETTRKYKDGSGSYPQFSEYVFPLTSVEVGEGADANMGTNLGFNSNADRICNAEGGGAQYWWLGDAHSSSGVWLVRSSGTVTYYAPGIAYGVRPAMNLSQNTLLNEYPDEDGYYTIYRPVETASDLLIGDKVKIGGTKYIVKAKGHEGYPQDSVTLISEYSVQQSVFGSSPDYADSTAKSLCEQYYNQLSTAEQNAILETTRKIKNSANQYPEFTEHIFLLNGAETGVISDERMGSNIGFANDNDRKVYSETGQIQYWWLADSYTTATRYISDTGLSSTSIRFNTETYAIRPALNLSPTAPIAAMDSEGYYTIKGADTISELKDKSLEILGVKL